jgi:hypothetical protein
MTGNYWHDLIIRLDSWKLVSSPRVLRAGNVQSSVQERISLVHNIFGHLSGIISPSLWPDLVRKHVLNLYLSMNNY